jgi:hypothetical protein
VALVTFLSLPMIGLGAPLSLIGWGVNNQGQLNFPPDLTNLVQVVGGGYHSAALRDDGSVVAWGDNYYGQGNVPTNLPPVRALAAGGWHILALLTNGTVRAWGWNDYGQCNIPANLSNVIAVAGGQAHSLALRANGTVTGWGWNNYGQINIPFGLSNVVAVAAGKAHSVALRRDGSIIGWGANYYEQITFPVSSNIAMVAAYGTDNTLLLTRDGVVYATGANQYVQTNVPPGLSNLVAIASGGVLHLVLRNDGTVQNWGNIPDPPADATNVVAFGAGPGHVLALRGDGSPALIIQPVGDAVYPGVPTIFQARAIGTEPLAYQWRFNGLDIPGATTPDLSFPSPQPTNGGNYELVVTNAIGATTSLVAVLTINEPPAITNQPQNVAVGHGAEVAFNVGVYGTPPLTYQWRFNGTNIPGATAATLTLTNVLADRSGDYQVVVTNPFGSATSSVATLSVTTSPPVIVTHPMSQIAVEGAEIILTPSVLGLPPPAYQWFFNNAPIAGATNATFVFTNAQTANVGGYFVVATNDFGAVTSVVATVTVTPPPGFLWLRGGGGTNLDEGRAVAVDAAGNVFVAGYFNDTASFGGLNLVSAGSSDFFVARYDSAGGLVWLRQGVGSSLDRAAAITVDAGGNVIIAGWFNDEISMGVATLTSAGGSDIFLARYDPDGNLLWATNAGGAGNDQALGVAVGEGTNIFVTGIFSSAATFGATNVVAAGSTDVFLARYDVNGACVWVRQGGGASADTGRAVACDPSGNIFVAGDYFSQTVAFGATTLLNANFANGLYNDVFVAKYNRDGNELWAGRGGGSTYDYGRAVAVDAAGNVCVAGDFSGAATFGPASVNSAGLSDAFIAKYDPAGSLLWVNTGGGTSTDLAAGVATDGGGNIFLTGQIINSATFSGQTLSGASVDVFLAMYAPNGKLNYVRKAGGGTSNYGNAIAADRAGHLYLTGLMTGTPSFGHATYATAGGGDFFLAKFAAFDPALPPVLTVNLANQSVLFGADLTLSSGFNSIEPVTAQWWFNGGPLASATNTWLVLSNATAGLAGDYWLVLSNEFGAVTSAVATVIVIIERDFVWTRSAGGASNDVALATLATSAGDIYVAGYFTDTADFDGVNLVSAGGEDIFVARYNPLGTLIWVQQFGGPGNDRATALCREPLGELVMAGTFSDTVLFDTNLLVSAGGTDVFLAHLTTAGGLNWVRQGGGASNDVAQAVAAHSVASGIYVAGFAQANATFGTTTLTISGTTNKMFLAKYDTSGNFVWAATTANTGPSEGRALACDAGNFVYLGGTRAGSVSFGGLLSTGAMSGFVARYSSGGNTASWVRWFGPAPNSPTFNNRVNGLALDTSSNVFVTGEFQGEVYLLGSTNGPLSYNTNQADGFLLKLDPAGTPQWVKTISGPGADGGNSVTLDSLGNPYVTGSFSTKAAIGNTLLTSAGGQDMFVALFDTTGALVKARRAGGAADDVGQAVATDGAGRVFVAGSHAAPAAFGTNSLTTAGGSDAFLTRLDFFGAQTPPQITTQPLSQSVKLGSNVVLNVGAISGLPVTFRWRLNGVNINGATSNSFRLNNPQLANLGDYSVVVQSSAGAVTSLTATVSQEITPDFWWLRRTGSTGDDQALAVAVDATNNAVYVAGLFTGTNPGLSNLVSSGGTDAFLARYDTGGNLIWARRAGGTLADAAQAVAVDRSGNVLVAGYFYSGTAGFGSFTITNRSTPTASFSDLFLAKYDSAGNVLWARQGGGTTNLSLLNRSDTATALVADGADNIYLTGSYHSVVNLGGLVFTNLNSTNFFLAKYDGTGNALWARTTSGTNTSQGNGICLDAATNVYVTGFLLGSLNLGNGVLTNLNNPFLNSSAFVAKYDRDGTLQWARKSSGNAGVGQAVAVDAAGSLYATSYKRDYGNGLLLAKYDNTGTPLWQRVAAISCCTGDYTSAPGLALDRLGNPIVAGFGNGTIEGITSSFAGGYVLKYRSDGSGFWMLRCASLALGGTGPAAIALDQDDNAYIVGRFTGTSFFGATSNLVSVGLSDTFLAKLGLRPPGFGASQTNLLLVAGSNTTLQVVGAVGTGPLRYQWQLNGTNIVGATNATYAVNNFAYDRAGRYAVVISNQVGVTTGKVAAVGFIPVLNISPGPGAAVVNWSGVFTLQSATNVAGPYADLIPATSPFTNLFGPGEAQRYFRLRVPSPNITGNWQAGQFKLDFAGSPGRRYAIEASTNLVNWTPVATDFFPFTLQDSNPVVVPQKFFRAVLLP